MSRAFRLCYFGAILVTFPFERILEFTQLPVWKLCVAPKPALLTQALSAEYGLSIVSRDMSYQTIGLVSLLTIASLICSALGLKRRISDALSFISVSFLIIYWSQFCFTTHELTPIPVSLLLWNLFPAEFAPGPAIRNQRIHFTIAFLSAGISKVLNGGANWVLSDSLRNILLLQNFLFENAWLHSMQTELNAWLVGQPKLCRFLSLVAVGLELSAPIALIRNRPLISFFIVSGLALMQLGILLVVYINFVTWIPIYLFWIPESVWGRLDSYLQTIIEAFKGGRP